MMREFMDFEILKLGAYSITASKIVYVVVLAIICRALLWLLKVTLSKYKTIDEGQKYTIYTIVKYFLIVAFISASLKLMGIDVSVLMAGSAALLVGIGLGLQGLFYDFISGIILLTEGTIRVGNVIEIGDKRVEILSIRFRTSIVKTREEKEIVIPNSFLTKNEIINWSSQRNINRHQIEVHVNAQDTERAMMIIQEVIKQHPKATLEPEPYVRIEEFTSYSVVLKLLFWSEEVLAVGRMLGDIRLLILKSFQKNNIVMPFPHQIVTLNKKE